MKIYCDLTCMMNPHLTGVGVYASQIYKELIKRTNHVQAIYRFTRYKRKKYLDPQINPKQYSCLNDFFSNTEDVFWGPDCKLISKGKQKKIVTIHDIQPYMSDTWSDPSILQKMRKSLKSLISSPLSGIIVPTESVKSDLIKYFPELKIPIQVIYHGCEHIEIKTPPNTPEKFKNTNFISQPFILCLGTVERRKNQKNLIRAFSKSKLDFNLVIAGGLGYGGLDVVAEIEQSNKKKKIFHIGYVTNSEKDWLLHNAQSVAYPSFYEGFGIPLVEAMRVNKPILTSNYGAMSEVVGQQAILVDPFSIDEISLGLEKLTRTSQVSYVDQLKKFKWKTSAENHLNLFLSVHT